MKRFKILSLLTLLVLVVTLASCGMTQPGYGDEYPDRPMRSRSVYTDPYYGNAPTIIRDPYTGQYYEVTPVNPYGYGYPGAYPYDVYGNNHYYGRGGYNNYPRRSQSAPQQQQKSSETINRAKDMIKKHQ
jgi:hypothetical protein